MINNIVNNKKINYKKVARENNIIKTFFRIRKYLLVKDGLLYRHVENRTICEQIVLNHKSIDVLFHYYHDCQNHLGEERTRQIFCDRFYWPGMNDHIRNMVKSCTTCRARKALPANNKEDMFHRPLSTIHMQVLSLDHLVITKQCDKMQCLTIVDEFTKFIFIIPVKKIESRYHSRCRCQKIFFVESKKTTSTPYHSQDK